MFVLTVGNLSPLVTDDHLSELFGSVAEVKYLSVYKNLETGDSFLYGHVAYSSAQSAEQAIELYNGYQLLGEELQLSFYEPRNDLAFRSLLLENIALETTVVDILDILELADCHRNLSKIVKRTCDSSSFFFLSFESRAEASATIDVFDGKLVQNRVWYLSRALHAMPIGDHEEKDSSDITRTVLIQDPEGVIDISSLYREFSNMGKVETVQLHIGPSAGVPTSSFLVTFSKSREAASAVKYLDNQRVGDGDKPIRVSLFVSEEEPSWFLREENVSRQNQASSAEDETPLITRAANDKRVAGSASRRISKIPGADAQLGVGRARKQAEES